MTTFPELQREFEAFSDDDLRDDHKLIDWLERALSWACAWETVELPDRDVFAIRIGKTRRILPDLPPSVTPDDPVLAEWLLIYAVSLLITHPASRKLDVVYWNFVLYARTYLGRIPKYSISE